MSRRFVAKPIGRLGGPGLIPVSFVEIRDPTTGRAVENVSALLESGSVPRVDEWKKKTADYHAASIPLGKFDTKKATVLNSPFTQGTDERNGGRGELARQQERALGGMSTSQSANSINSLAYSENSRKGANASSTQKSASPHSSQPPPTAIQDLPEGTFTSAKVVSFHREDDAYFFRIYATFLPLAPNAPAVRLILFRMYDDFYHFQISLLNAFPIEAGRNADGGERPPSTDSQPGTRILPYMPGPLDDVDDAVTESRREELDYYLRELIGLHRLGAAYILQDKLVRKFFNPREADAQTVMTRGDAETEFKARMAEIEEGIERARIEAGGAENGYGAGAGMGGESQSGSRSQSRTGGREDEEILARSAGGYSQPGSRSQSRSDRYSGGAASNGGAIPLVKNGSIHGSQSAGVTSRGPSPLPQIETRRGPPSAYTSGGAHSNSSRPPSSSTTDYSGLPTAATSSSWGNSQPQSAFSPIGGSSQPPPPMPFPLSNSQSQSQSQSSAPPAAYRKIKIFDRQTDDLIAIRVPPSVTFSQLLTKVRDRLGPDVRRLQFRLSGGAVGAGGGQGSRGMEFRDLEGDRGLEEWMGTGEGPLVLYAE